MKAFLFLLLTLICGKAGFSQTTPFSLVDQQLDSVIHLPFDFGKVSIIYFRDHTVHVDTVDLRKYKFNNSDSSVVFKLKDRSQKQIRLKEFWGLSPAYGSLQRIYNGRLLTLWRTRAPYVYKVENSLHTFYFFSETLSSTVYPLSTDLIESKVHDPLAKKELYAYVNEWHIPANSVDKTASYEFLYAVADAMVTITINFGGAILECLLKSLCK